jgi:hypothetical protein
MARCGLTTLLALSAAKLIRHGERSEAIQGVKAKSGSLRFARDDGVGLA